MPPTIPEVRSIVATLVALLIHVPPVRTSVSPEVAPVHTVALPEIIEGNGFTTTGVDEVHPLGAL